MKDSFLSKLMGKAGVDATAAVAEATASLQADFDAFKLEAGTQLEASATALSQAVETVKEADAKIAELQASLTASAAQLATLQAFADQAAADKAKLEAEAETARLDARKKKIVAAVGTAKADALMASTLTLADADFESIVGALGASFETEAKTKLFTETGVAGETDATVVAAPSGVMAILLAEQNKTQGA